MGRGGRGLSLEEHRARFWARVDRQNAPDPAEACWLWTGTVSGGEWSSPKVWSSDRNTNVSAYRLAIEYDRGAPLPKDVTVRRCERSAMCVRPDHLRVLGPEENAQVAHAILNTGRGRERAKVLTAEQVREMRERYATGGVTLDALAADYGVSRESVRLAVRGLLWREAGGPITPAKGRNP